MKQVLIILLLMVSAAAINGQYIIYNPYDGVDFSKSYKSMTHGHTTMSDGAMTPAEYIEAYDSLNYSILAISDHDVSGEQLAPTWTWEQYIDDEPTVRNITDNDTTSEYFPTLNNGQGMLAVEANEMSYIDHMQNWFTGFYFSDGYTVQAFLDSLRLYDGLSSFNHPRMYARTPEYYNDWFNDYRDVVVGIEVINKLNAYPDDGLWDSINMLRAPDSLIWGLAQDDQHETFSGYRASSNRHFLDTLSEDALRESLHTGSFTFSYKNGGYYSENIQPTPVLTGVTVSNEGIITIAASNSTSVQWIDMAGDTIGIDYSVDLSTITGHYVRAILFNSYGRTWTQPFGFEEDTNVFDDADHYVSTLGDDDTGDGSFSNPWATIQKGVEEIGPGDTLCIRGGTYYPGTELIYGVNYNPTTGHGEAGTYASPVTIMGYPGESVIVDLSQNYPPGLSTCGFDINSAGYVVVKDIIVQNVYSRYSELGEIYTSDFSITNNTHVTMERVTARYGGGVGFFISANDTIRMLYCDTHHHCDSLGAGDAGGDGDGMIFSSGSDYGENDHMYVEVGWCRMWHNSDDGVDMATAKQIYFHDNYSFNNGTSYTEDYRGDGTGIKMSCSHIKDASVRIVRNNCFHYNSGGAIADLNLYTPGGPFQTYYNNSSYRDDTGHQSGRSGGDWNFYNDSASVISANNIVFEPTKETVTYSDYYSFLAAYSPYDTILTISTNTWQLIDSEHWYNEENPSFTVTVDDFVSVDTTGATAARQSDGSFPNNDFYNKFMHLTPMSDLIDGGTDVGLEYEGDAPDLGAFEHAEATSTPLILTTTPYSTWTRGTTTGGNVTSDGGGTITARGVCWSTSINPTTSDSHTVNGSGVGEFTSTITGLSVNTTYHVRAYATNEEGTAYGSDITFETPSKSYGRYNGQRIRYGSLNVIIR